MPLSDSIGVIVFRVNGSKAIFLVEWIYLWSVQSLPKTRMLYVTLLIYRHRLFVFVFVLVSMHLHAHTHTHTHTRYKYNQYWWLLVEKRRESVRRREEVGFQFDLKEDSEDKCLTERKRALDDRSDVLLKPLSYRADLKNKIKQKIRIFNVNCFILFLFFKLNPWHFRFRWNHLDWKCWFLANALHDSCTSVTSFPSQHYVGPRKLSCIIAHKYNMSCWFKSVNICKRHTWKNWRSTSCALKTSV